MSVRLIDPSASRLWVSAAKVGSFKPRKPQWSTVTPVEA